MLLKLLLLEQLQLQVLFYIIIGLKVTALILLTMVVIMKMIKIINQMIKNQMINQMTKNQMIIRTIKNQMIIKINKMWVKNNFKSLASKDGISKIVSIMKSYFLKWYDSLTSPAAAKAAASQLQHSFSLAPATIILSSLNLNIS